MNIPKPTEKQKNDMIKKAIADKIKYDIQSIGLDYILTKEEKDFFNGKKDI